MAKMFYTLTEAAEKLGVSEDQVKELAAGGKLQQFRDRDKLMFKREQVDALVAQQTAPMEESSGPIPLVDSSDTDSLNLSPADTGPGGTRQSGTATGVSVFDTGEVEPVDPAAQTQVNPPGGQDLALESVGSGSGLLDLTRESDDTSLGAELLDEIYPGSGGDASESKLGTALGSSSIFESALGTQPGKSVAAASSGAMAATAVAVDAAPMAAAIAYDDQAYDPAGNGMSVGLLLGALLALLIGLIVSFGALAGVETFFMQKMGQSVTSLLIWCGGLAVLSAVFAMIGLAIGKRAQ
ncbi:MAG TPA: helix-turn-helix domain-containing protein [Phycisphaeraceae bacterium]